MNANVIAELKRIAEDNDGLLMPEQVVEQARPNNSPLHSRFEWDNTKAAHAHRLWQARQLIKVCVEVISGSDGSHEIFVSLSDDRKEEGGYRTMVSVLSDKEKRERLLLDALAELNLFQAKYSRLKELAGVFRAAKKIKRHG